MENRTQMFESIDLLASRTGQKELCEAIKKLYDACFESHKDRTTGGNFGGKTIRDQNNYDSKRNNKDTKTSSITRDRYGFTKDGVKGMGVGGKFGSAWDIKNDGFNDTGANSSFSKAGRAVMKAGEKRFFDPKKVLERDEGGEVDSSVLTPAEEDFYLKESWKDADSYYNNQWWRILDQLDKTASAWNGQMDTRRFEYDKLHPDIQREDFAERYADMFGDENIPGSWRDAREAGYDIFDKNKSFDLSDEGKLDARSRYEDYYSDCMDNELPEEEEDVVEATKPAVDKDDEAWTKAGYVSGDMFGESIDKLAKATGKKDLCEAVKKLYKACFESFQDELTISELVRYARTLNS